MTERNYNHYFRPCPFNEIDLYRFARIFEITDSELFHALKKIIAAGKRGNKDRSTDIMEAVDSLVRSIEMDCEENPNLFNDINKLKKIKSTYQSIGKIFTIQENTIYMNNAPDLGDLVKTLVKRPEPATIPAKTTENTQILGGTSDSQPQSNTTLPGKQPVSQQPQKKGPYKPNKQIIKIHAKCPDCESELMSDEGGNVWCTSYGCGYVELANDKLCPTCGLD